MTKDTADYEESEKIAITNGKAVFAQNPWLFDRRVEQTKGFFAELRSNDEIHPNFYSVHCVDGVGTKLFLSAWSGDYSLAGIDAVMMNANDMATLINARISEANIYIAAQEAVKEQHMGAIMSGVVEGLRQTGRGRNSPNIGKIETASLDEMIALGVPGKGWDISIALTGYIAKEAVPELQPSSGDVIVGVSSTGLHSNGFTGARHVLFRPEVEYRDEWKGQYKGRFLPTDTHELLQGKTFLEVLQVPTASYMPIAADLSFLLQDNDLAKYTYGVNITGGGLSNFNRAGNAVSFEITDPLPVLPIHAVLAQESGWTPHQAYTKQNMGMGFAFVTPSMDIAEHLVHVINTKRDLKAQIVGDVARLGTAGTRTVHHKPYEGKPVVVRGYNN